MRQLSFNFNRKLELGDYCKGGHFMTEKTLYCKNGRTRCRKCDALRKKLAKQLATGTPAPRQRIPQKVHNEKWYKNNKEVLKLVRGGAARNLNEARALLQNCAKGVPHAQA